MSSYLDSLYNIASSAPSPEDAQTLKRLANIAGSSNYAPVPVSATSLQAPPVPIPAPSTAAERQSNLLMQQSELNNPPAHGLRRVIGDIGGVMQALHSHDIDKGVATAENIKSAPYHKAASDLANKAAPLAPIITEEEKRTQEAGQNYRVANTAEQGDQRIAEKKAADAEIAKRDKDNATLKKQHEDELALKDRQHAEAILDRETRLKAATEENNTLKQKMQEREQEFKKREDELNRTAAQVRAQTVSGSKNILPEYKEKGYDAEYQKAANIKNDEARADYIKSLDPAARNYVAGKLGSEGIPNAPAGTPSQMTAAGAAKQTAGSINAAREVLARPGVTDNLGMISGRIEAGKLYLGSDNKNVVDMQPLSTLLTLITATEAATLTGGRTTAALFKLIKQGSGNLSMSANQLKSALDTIYEFAKRRSRGQVTDESAALPDKIKVVK